MTEKRLDVSPTTWELSHQASASVRLELSTPPRGEVVPFVERRARYARATSARNASTTRRYLAGGSRRSQWPAPGTTTVRTRSSLCTASCRGAIGESGARGAGSARQARPSVLNHGRETHDVVRALKCIDPKYAPASVTDRLRNRPKDVGLRSWTVAIMCRTRLICGLPALDSYPHQPGENRPKPAPTKYTE